MKKLFIILFLSLSISAFAQKDSLVDIFDQNRKILKLNATPKELKDVKQKYSGKFIYVRTKENGVVTECKYAREDNLFLQLSI